MGIPYSEFMGLLLRRESAFRDESQPHPDRAHVWKERDPDLPERVIRSGLLDISTLQSWARDQLDYSKLNMSMEMGQPVSHSDESNPLDSLAKFLLWLKLLSAFSAQPKPPPNRNWTDQNHLCPSEEELRRMTPLRRYRALRGLGLAAR